MGKYIPKFTAYGADAGEGWRIIRLEDAWKDIKRREPFLKDRVLTMHDHKGQLDIGVAVDGLSDASFDSLVNTIITAWNKQNEYEIEIEIVEGNADG